MTAEEWPDVVDGAGASLLTKIPDKRKFFAYARGAMECGAILSDSAARGQEHAQAQE